MKQLQSKLLNLILVKQQIFSMISHNIFIVLGKFQLGRILEILRHTSNLSDCLVFSTAELSVYAYSSLYISKNLF